MTPSKLEGEVVYRNLKLSVKIQSERRATYESDTSGNDHGTHGRGTVQGSSTSGIGDWASGGGSGSDNAGGGNGAGGNACCGEGAGGNACGGEGGGWARVDGDSPIALLAR